MDNQESSHVLTRKIALIAMLWTSPVLLLFLYLGDVRKGIGAWVCAGIVLATARTRWDLRGHIGYWVVLVLALLVQVPFVLLVPWTDKNLSFVSLLPVGLLDFAIVYGGLKLVEKAVIKSSGSPS